MVGESSESAGAGRAESLVFLVVAAVETGLATWLILAGRPFPAGVCSAIAAAAIVLGSVRIRPQNRSAAGFALVVVDRFFDGLVLSAIAWSERSAHPEVSAAALVCLGAGFLCAYASARARSVGFSPDSSRNLGIAIRAAAMGLITASLLVTAAAAAAVAIWAAAAIQIGLAIARSVRVAKESRA